MEKGACLVVKGTAPLEERRQIFLDVYQGIGRIANYIKKSVEEEKSDLEVFEDFVRNHYNGVPKMSLKVALNDFKEFKTKENEESKNLDKFTL